MVCASCGTANDAGARFCNQCGAPLQAGCPACGATNKPGAKFCSECGTALAAVAGVGTSVASQPATTGLAERRLVSVLFADLVGFTPFAEERDAEDVRDILSRYFDLAGDVIARYGGTVEKFIGDAVMAVWGAPVAHEDDAERAVRAALELADAAHALGLHIQVRAGVLTGEAAVTVGATNQGIVAGDLVNTASRLQSVAAPGTVLVGEATYRAASGAIAFEEAGEQSLKGKQAPLPAWRALRVVAERGGRNRSDALEAPFVGRADELRLLKELFHATGRERRVRLVSVMGPAGIGKSRLTWEFLKYIDGLVESVYWHSGRSPAYGEGITFWALGEMVRGRCGLLETDDERTTRQKVADALARWLPDEDERRWVEPALLTLLGIESGTPAEQLFSAWRTFFERIAAEGTVALIFEDLHHADTGLLDFVDHLLEWSRGLPIYIVTLARPDLLDKRPTWGAGKRSFSSIYLEPLPESEMRALLAGLVPGLPEGAAAAITRRADGIPLYAVETVRMLVSDGKLREESGVYVPVGDLTELAVPETLTALVASRLDSLDPADRAIVHDAAVLGQSFTLEALSAISSSVSDELEARLEGLVRRELLTRHLDPRSPDLGQYAFMQAVIREVAYNTLARRERKSRHLAAARYFEQLGSDELAGALAGHYLAAHHNAGEGPEADALATQAHIALRAAAERAASLGAHEQAVAFLEQALTVTSDEAERADLLDRAGRSAGAAARYEQAEELLRSAIDIRKALGDRPGAVRTTGALGGILLDAMKLDSALSLLESAASEYADLWPGIELVELKARPLARAYLNMSQFAQAVETADAALEQAEHGDIVPALASALVNKGAGLGGLGRLREGIALIRAGEELARDHALQEVLLTALVVGGYHLGEVDQGASLGKYREGLALARRLGNRPRARLFVNNIGYTGFIAGDWEAALAELTSTLTDDLDPASRVWLLGNAVVIRACRGDDVSHEVRELEQLTRGGATPMLVPLVEARAVTYLATGDLVQARRNYLRLAELDRGQAPSSFYEAARAATWGRDLDVVTADLEALDATGVHGRIVETRRMTVRAAVAALEGRQREALALYRDAIAAWRDLGMPWDEALTGIDVATVLDGSDPEVRAAAQSVREILVRLGARPFIERLDAELARQPVRPAGGTLAQDAPLGSH